MKCSHCGVPLYPFNWRVVDVPTDSNLCVKCFDTKDQWSMYKKCIWCRQVHHKNVPCPSVRNEPSDLGNDDFIKDFTLGHADYEGPTGVEGPAGRVG